MVNIKALALRERIADLDYEIAKEEIRILSRQESLESTNMSQRILENIELDIKIHEAIMAKHINEVKFLRLELQNILNPS